MPAYQKYASSLKICFALGLQYQWIDPHTRNQIPHTTAAYWKKHTNADEFIGQNLAREISQNLSDIQNAYHPANAFPLKIFKVYCRLAIKIVNLFSKASIKKTLIDHKKEFIHALDQATPHISYKSIAKLLHISPKTLYHWRTLVRFPCPESPLNLCAKRHPNQATLHEVNTIRAWLKNPDFNHWSIHAIWATAFKTHKTALSKNAWYKYNACLNLRPKANLPKKPKKTPLRAFQINQIWHADITIFKTADGNKYFIYTVLDNFSRRILDWQIHTRVSAKHRLNSIKNALNFAFSSKIPPQLQLVTDAGPENNNSTIKEFLQNSGVQLSIAQVDIPQSNSMMEAFYHTAKYRYLYQKPIQNLQALTLRFQELVHEYNFIKPHYALGIYTPNEVYNGADPNTSHRDIYAQAAIIRRETNKNTNCPLNC